MPTSGIVGRPSTPCGLRGDRTASALQVAPSVVEFSAFERGSCYVATFSVRNASDRVLRFRLTPPPHASPFKVLLRGRDLARTENATVSLPPGLSNKYEVTFEVEGDEESEPEVATPAIVHDALQLKGDDGSSLEVPLMARRACPLLEVAPPLCELGLVVLTQRSARCVEVQNCGARPGRFVVEVLDASDNSRAAITVSPQRGKLTPLESVNVKVEVHGLETGDFRGIVRVRIWEFLDYEDNEHVNTSTPPSAEKIVDVSGSVVEHTAELVLRQGLEPVHSLFFGSLFAGETRTIETLLRNNGPQPLSFKTSISFGGVAGAVEEDREAYERRKELRISPADGCIDPFREALVAFIYHPRAKTLEEIQRIERKQGATNPEDRDCAGSSDTLDSSSPFTLLPAPAQPLTAFASIICEDLQAQNLTFEVSAKMFIPRLQLSPTPLDFGDVRSYDRADILLSLKNLSGLPIDTTRLRQGNLIQFAAGAAAVVASGASSGAALAKRIASVNPSSSAMSVVFHVAPDRGELAPGEQVTIRVSFLPLDAVEYADDELPLFVDDEFYVNFSLRGEGIYPHLSFSTNRVVLPTVPLGMTANAQFHVYATGYDHLELNCRVPLDTSRAPLTVLFPRGKTLSMACPSLPVELRFSSTSSVAFNARVEFFDADGNSFALPVAGCAENCLFTNYSFLQTHGLAAELSEDFGGSPQRKASSKSDLESEIVSKSSLEFQFYTHASGHFPVYLLSTKQAQVEIEKAKENASASGFVVVDPSTDHEEEESNSTSSLLTQSTTNVPFSEGEIQLVMQYLNANFLRTPVVKFPEEFADNAGRPLYELLDMICIKKPGGPAIPSLGGGTTKKKTAEATNSGSKATVYSNSVAQASKKDQLTQLTTQFMELLRFLRSYGAMVHDVYPEQLLSQEFYLRACENPQVDPALLSSPSYASLPFVARRQVLKSEWKAVSSAAWMKVIYQVIKCFLLSRITWKGYQMQLQSDENSSGENTARSDKRKGEKHPNSAGRACQGSNVYSEAEMVLIQWLCDRVRALHKPQNAPVASLGGAILETQLLDIGRDLRDGRWFFHLIAAHIPTLSVDQSAYHCFRWMLEATSRQRRPPSGAQLQHQAVLLQQTLGAFGLDFGMDVDRFLRGFTGREILFGKTDTSTTKPPVSMFSGPPTLMVPAKRSATYPLTFTPTWMYHETRTFVLLNTSTQQQFEFELSGYGEEPLAQDHVVLTCQARTSIVHNFNVFALPGGDANAAQMFKVESDLRDVVGAPTIAVPAGGLNRSVKYPLTFSPLVSGSYFGSVTFTNEATSEYIWYTVEASVSPPEPETTLEMRAPVRGAVGIEIGLANPLDSETTFTVELRGRGLLGPTTFTLEARQSGVYELVYSPLLVMKDAGEEGAILFSSDTVGQFWYRLILVAESADPHELDDMSCAVGDVCTQPLWLQNPSDQELQLQYRISNTRNFSIKGSNSTTNNTVKRVALPPFGRASVVVEYTPSSLSDFENTSIVFFEKDVVSDWEFTVRGRGRAPSVMKPLVVTARVNEAASTLFTFKNPFAAPLRVDVKLVAAESENSPPSPVFDMLLKKRHVLLESFGLLQVPISFIPRVVSETRAELVIHGGDEYAELEWRYPLRGVAEAPLHPRVLAVLACQARDSVEKRVDCELLAAPDDMVLANETFTVDWEIDAGRFGPMATAAAIERALTVTPLPVPSSSSSFILPYTIRFEPLRPYRGSIVLLVKKSSGGLWRFDVSLDAGDPPVDDVLSIESSLNQTSSVSFQLRNQFRQPAAFLAEFSAGSSSAFTVYPAEGELPPYGSEDGTMFVVSFTPTGYGKMQSGQLVICTEEMQWTFNVKGVYPDATPGSRASGPASSMSLSSSASRARLGITNGGSEHRKERGSRNRK
ncbi:hypothetical protein PPTG_21988 [Phytophthora nicotianae INRA-310]|uniref:Calponin-homology (CH) domain-containing protein n=1 Tax=Phytophthora nicotianae (strain INRA-310) TaxID=761204 RepID=W2QTD5_PHYN3|nr:hypothetical protein PPTG_21988 [Phytophthora nicotianae INRA-310]ETN15759.1 hypothetical protein PPTG_21988 [Phytophthora nicotianae INRA-310]